MVNSNWNVWQVIQINCDSLLRSTKHQIQINLRERYDVIRKTKAEIKTQNRNSKTHSNGMPHYTI